MTSLHGAAMENGFNMWSFNGKLLYSMPRDRFQQLSWRPRVPSLLSKEKEEEIRKNLKDYSRWVPGFCAVTECVGIRVRTGVL